MLDFKLQPSNTMASTLKLQQQRPLSILQILLLVTPLALGQHEFRIGNHAAANRVNMPSISSNEAEGFIDRAFESMEQKFIKQGATGW
jgi:hypothetical protein